MPHPVFLSRIYDETFGLMVEARNYLAYCAGRDGRQLGDMDRLRVSCEALRVTSRLAQVMAWLMTRRAVQEGEISEDEAMAEPNRLSGAEVCLDDSFARDGILPGGLRSLLGRSLALYLRITRIEAQMLSRAASMPATPLRTVRSGRGSPSGHACRPVGSWRPSPGRDP